MTRARRLLQMLNPVAIVFGPVFEKEVYVSGRRTSTYVVRGLACLALLIVLGITTSGLYFTVLNPARADIPGAADVTGGAMRLQQLQSTATTLAAVVGWFSYILLLLVTPVFLAPSVMEEVRNRTLPALLTTPLTATEIVLGKVFGRGVQILILALLPIPILLIARTFGGIPLDGILAFSLIIFASVFEMAAISIAVSVVSRRSASAIVLAYCGWIGLNAAPPIALAYLSKELHLFHVSDAFLMSMAAPVALGMTTAQKLVGQFAPGGDSIWIVSSLYHMVLAMLMLGMSIALMRRTMTREGAGVTGSSEAKPAKQSSKQKKSLPQSAAPAPDSAQSAAPEPAADARFAVLSAIAQTNAVPSTTDSSAMDGLVSPSETSGSSVRTVSDDPVLWRELRTRVFRRKWHRWVAFAAIALVTLWITIGAFDDGGVALPMVLGVLLTVALLQSAVLTTAGISTERESKTWETLLTTPLSGGEILWSKLAGAVYKTSWTILGGVAFTLFFGIFVTQAAHPYMIVAWLLVSVGPCFFLACTGTLFSLIFSRATVAAVFNLGLALAIWVALPLILLFISQTIAAATGHTADTDLPPRLALLINPYAWFGISVESAVSRWGSPIPSGKEFNILEFFRVPGLVFFLLQCVFTAGFAAAGVGVMIAANALFPRFSGRTPPEYALPIQATPVAGR